MERQSSTSSGRNEWDAMEQPYASCQGDRCPFRHSEPAKFRIDTCKFWMKGRCTKLNCPYRHPDPSSKQKVAQTVFCFFESTPSGCTRPDCQYKHSRPKQRMNNDVLYGCHSASSNLNEDTHAMAAANERGSDFLENYSSPCSLKIVSCTSNSVSLSWSEPDEDSMNIESYKIGFRESKTGQSKWKFINTEKTQTSFTVHHLESDKDYDFKVCIIDEEGVEGSFTSPVTATTESSLAKHVKQMARKITNGKPEIYQISLETIKSSINRVAKTKKCIFSKTGQQKIGTPGKTIMLVGATGSGKSTLLDGIINYITNVSWEDDFRFSMVDLSNEEQRKQTDQTQSQTEWITCYTIRTMSGSNLDYDLHIIDTPGFGDTRGIGRDQELINQIREFFTTPGNQGITCLDAVCFVTQAPLARLTVSQKYLFDAILSIFGQDIANNIYVLITFADGNEAPVLGALKAAKIPFKKAFKFNNSALFAKPLDSEESKFGRLFWEMGKESFRDFFGEVRFVETKSLQLTKEVLQLRRNIEATIEGLQPQIHEGMNKLNTIRQEEEILKKHENDVEANKNFTYEVDEIHMRQVALDSGTYVTNCIVCNRTCHFPCHISRDEDKMKCSAMRHNSCSICPKRCCWDLHRNNDFRFETYSKTVRKTYNELKLKYNIARQEKQRQSSVLANVKSAFIRLYREVMKMMTDVRGYINKLNEIALRPNPLTDVEYIDLLMENEKSEKKYGWQERLKFYQKMKEQAELAAKAAATSIRPWGHVTEIVDDFI